MSAGGSHPAPPAPTGTTDTLSYDGLNRLTQAVISNPGLPLNVTKTVTYDAIGNITSKSDVGDYAYDPIHVHAVSGIAPGATGTLTATFTYDGDGNLLTGKGRTLAWTSFDMVSQIAQGANTLAFVYDSEHARLKETSSDGSTKYYLNDPISGIIEEKAIGASLAVSWNDYVMKGAEMVALHVTAATPQIRYFHKDHLGSIVALTDESGAVVERDSYDAWGERRNPSGPDDPLYPGLSLTSQITRGYTGHEQLDQVGLVHMNGRIYDPVIGKMMSADPTVPNPTDAQAYNRYAYVGNNPLSFTDPSGFKAENNHPDLDQRDRHGQQTRGGNGKDPIGGRDDHGGDVAGGADPRAKQLACGPACPVIGGAILIDWGLELLGWGTIGVLSSLGGDEEQKDDTPPGAPTSDPNTTDKNPDTPSGTSTGAESNGGIVIDDRIRDLMGVRGWSEEELKDITKTPPAGTTTDNRTPEKTPDGLPRNDPATVYGDKDGYTVVNDRTKEVVQISDKTDSGWVPDSRINWKGGN